MSKRPGAIRTGGPILFNFGPEGAGIRATRPEAPAVQQAGAGPQPADFGAAMGLMMAAGHDVRTAIKLASEKWPGLYAAYRQELLHPTEDEEK